MTTFIKTIKTADGDRVVTFNRIYAVGGYLYSISIFDKEPFLTFNMENKDGKWTFSNIRKVPEWLQLFEADLAEAIVNSLTK